MYLEYMKGGKTIRELARGNGSISLRRAEAVIRLKHVELEMRMVRLGVVGLCCGRGFCSWRSPLRNKTCFLCRYVRVYADHNVFLAGEHLLSMHYDDEHSTFETRDTKSWSPSIFLHYLTLGRSALSVVSNFADDTSSFSLHLGHGLHRR